MVNSLVRVIDEDGTYDKRLEPHLADSDLKKLYRLILLARAADNKAVALQRQGRIGPYVPCVGHEAAHIGSAYALMPQDWIFPHYRSQAAAIALGMSLRSFFAELFGSSLDVCKARGMPNALGDRSINYVALSAPVGDMIPHAVGFSLAAKLRGDPVVALVYFGEGATSSNDFHSEMNFAGVFRTPTVFFCVNNQYAISVPVSRQTASETIAIKAIAYGFKGLELTETIS